MVNNRTPTKVIQRGKVHSYRELQLDYIATQIADLADSS
jgi:hypothetical protein